jgi:uncharacterized membrane protein
VVTQFEPSANGLRARSSDTVVLLTVPAGVLKPGHYTVTVAASARAKQWTLDVK